MKKLTPCLLAIAMLSMVGCISIHNNKGAEYIPPTSAAPSHYQTITEVGKATVSATVTGNNLLGIISWGLPSTFADGGNFGAGETAAIPLPFKLPVPIPGLGGDPYADFKKACVYIACKENDCDYIINANYIIDVKDYFVFKQATVTVTGFPVKITGYKLIEK